MSAEVIPLPGADETVAAFVARLGEASTLQVAHRFGWTPGEARQRLNALMREGEVERVIDPATLSSRVAYIDGGRGGGARSVVMWKAKQTPA